MTYSKPELLPVEAALEAIRSVGKIGPSNEDEFNLTPVAAYDVDE